MSQRLTHVKTMISKFDSESNSPGSGKPPPIAPKPNVSRKSPGVSQESPRGGATSLPNIHAQPGTSLPGNDSDNSLGVSPEKPIRVSKRKIEWPPKKRDNDSNESESDESCERNHNPTKESAHHEDVPNSSVERNHDEDIPNSSVERNRDEDVSNSSVERNHDEDIPNSSIERNRDEDVSNSSVEIDIESPESSNTNQSQFSDSSESSVCGDEVDETVKAPSQSDTSKPHKQNYKQVTDEIVRTERTFVDDLKALFECYQTMLTVNGERELELEKKIEDVFSDFVPIFRLHSDTFLPIMEKHYAVEEFWVGRVFNENNFIVKTYKPFIVKQNENEKTLLELLKNPFISEAVDEVLKNHKRMLGCSNGYNVIFQRITRYSLLLKEYIKNLPDDCPDKPIAMLAMGKINDAAYQLNETKRNADDFNTQILNALDRITKGRQLELQPWERFVKEGPVEKISARSITRVQARYLFLFSGRLLICESSITSYVIKTQMEVGPTMKIEEINDPNKHHNSFRLRGKEKTFDLKFETDDAESDWRDALNRVITEDRGRRESFPRVRLTEENARSLGKQAPLWVKDQDCSMCMICCVHFTFNNRRHHCRACGQCVCGTCSNYKHSLQCLNGKSVRVCKDCKERLSGEKVIHEEDCEQTVQEASVESYLQFADSTRQFKEKYAILSGQGFIELKAKYKDRKAWKTIPIVGYKLNNVSDLDLCFKLSHPAYEYYFMCKNKDNYDKWCAKIEEVLGEFS